MTMASSSPKTSWCRCGTACGSPPTSTRRLSTADRSGGWYDPVAIATTNYYTTMSKKNLTAQRLLMGPWNHGAIRGPGSTFVGDVDFGPAALWGDPVYNAERLRWFDRWLRDIPTGVDADPPVRIF